MLASELAIFAARHGISPKVAWVLPALFERVADSQNMSVRQLVADATYNNHGLGVYLASVAEEVAEKAT